MEGDEEGKRSKDLQREAPGRLQVAARGPKGPKVREPPSLTTLKLQSSHACFQAQASA